MGRGHEQTCFLKKTHRLGQAHEKMCLITTSLINSETQIKITRDLFTPVRMATVKKTRHNKWEKTEH